MRRMGKEVAAGVAIFLAFVIFVAGFLFLKNVTMKAGTYTVTVKFSNVTGLEKSDGVSVSGLRVGKVKHFELDGRDVLVTIQIHPGFALPKDTHAQIKSLGMVGERFVDLIPGSSPQLLEEGDMIRGTGASDFSDITGTMEGLMQQAEDLLLKIRTTFDRVLDTDAQDAIRESLLNIRNLSSALDRNTAHLEKTLTNLDGISTNLDEILNERRAKIETSIDNFYAASGRLEGLANKVDGNLTSVQTLLSKIENQEGSVGKVIMSDELYNDFRHLTVELDELVQDLKKRPQKYLNLGFIKVF